MHQLSKIKDTHLEFQPIILRWTVFFLVQKSEQNPTMDLEGGFDSPGKKISYFY